tara:strand:+ start:2676 stop:4136 length:1461 start_codon:yes stop_codon:yes gene_type:complete
LWLYIPGAKPTSVSTPEAVDLTSASSWQIQQLSQSFTWSEKFTQPRSWWTIYKREYWMRRLCGLIPEPSTANHSLIKWIGSLVDSPVNRGVPQESDQESKIPGGSGRTSPEWFAKYDPSDSSWKTSQVSFLEELNTYSETWPRWGSVVNGEASKHPMLVHRIGANALSSMLTNNWETPRHTDGTGGAALNRPKGKIQLRESAVKWQTPAAFQGKYRRQVNQTERTEELLPAQAENFPKNWPTARASSANGSSEKERQEGNPKQRLETEAEIWPTPTTQEFPHPNATINEKGRRDPVRGKTDFALNLEDTASRWDTPDTMPERPNLGSNRTRGENIKPPGLGNQAKTWGTPTAQDSDKATHRIRDDHQNNLSAEAANWPTPAARDEKGAYSDEAMVRKDGKSRMDALPQVTERWLTPSANEDAAGTLDGNMQQMLSHQVQKKPKNGEVFSEKRQNSRLRLNPQFVEWLMGWPQNWVRLQHFVSSETE